MSFNLLPGDTIKTNYGTGPYRIEKISGPCTCQPPNNNWNRYCVWPVTPHYHLECTDLRPISSNLKKDGSLKKGGSYLGHYVETADGRFLSTLGQYDYLNDTPTNQVPDEILVIERFPRPAPRLVPKQLTLF